MKKVLIYGLSNTRGGIETYILSMQEQLQEICQFVYLIEKCDCIYQEDIQKFNGKIYFYKEHSSRRKKIQLLDGILRDFAKEIRFLYVNVSDISYLTLAVLMLGLKYNYRILVHSHNAMLEPIESKIHQITHKTIENISRLIFRSKYITCLAVSNRAGKYLYKNNKYEILHAGIDVKKYKFNPIIRDKIRLAYDVNDEYVYGFVGRIVPIKNPIFLIEVFKSILNLSDNKNIKLMIIGDGSLMNEVKEKVIQEKLIDKVIFVGEVTNVSDYLQALDFIIVPSISEGLSLVLMEAQAAGLPAVCSLDRIPKEIRITPMIKFVSLEEDAIYWAQECIKFSKQRIDVDRNNWNDIVYSSDFEVRNVAMRLKDKLI